MHLACFQDPAASTPAPIPTTLFLTAAGAAPSVLRVHVSPSPGKC